MHRGLLNEALVVMSIIALQCSQTLISAQAQDAQPCGMQIWQVAKENGLILEIASFRSIIVVLHTDGIAVSSDAGINFIETGFEKKLQPHAGFGIERLIYIDSVQRIFVSTGHELYVSKDLGRLFSKSKFLSAFDGIRSIQSIDGDVFVSFEGEQIVTGVIFISRDGGITFNNSVCFGWDVHTSIVLLDDHLFVRDPNGELFVSNDRGHSFYTVSKGALPWISFLEARQKIKADFLQDIQKLTLPALMPLRKDQKLHINLNGNIYTRLLYANPNFNPHDPTPGLVYQFENSKGEVCRIHSMEIPRRAALGDHLYYATFSSLYMCGEKQNF